MRKLRITVENKSYEVTVEDLTEVESYRSQPKSSSPDPVASAAPASPSMPAASPTRTSPKPRESVEEGSVTSPMAGAIQSILVKPGDAVTTGQPVVILEAMKMENQITAPYAGTVKSVEVSEGDTVTEGQVLLTLG